MTQTTIKSPVTGDLALNYVYDSATETWNPQAGGGTGTSASQAQGTAADGAAAVGNPVQTGGVDGSGNVQAFATDTSGNQAVVGNIASAATDSGNPVKAGTKYNSTRPTFTDGQRADLQGDNRGNASVLPCLSQTAAADAFTNGNIGWCRDQANSTILAMATAGYLYNGSTWDRQRGDTTGTYVVGNVAHDAVNSGNPVGMGGYASDTRPTDVAVGDRVNAWMSLAGQHQVAGVAGTAADGVSNTQIVSFSNTTVGAIRPAYSAGSVYNGVATAASSAGTWDRVKGDVNGQVAQLHAMTGSRWSYAAATGGITNTTTAVQIAASAGGSLRNYVTGVQLSADALGAATEVAIRDGAGGTVLLRVKIGTAGIVGAQNLTFDSPLKGSAATLLEVVTLTATVTGGVYVNVQGFTGV